MQLALESLERVARPAAGHILNLVLCLCLTRPGRHPKKSVLLVLPPAACCPGLPRPAPAYPASPGKPRQAAACCPSLPGSLPHAAASKTMPTDGPAMSAYELQRQQNIAQNQQMLESLGLHNERRALNVRARSRGSGGTVAEAPKPAKGTKVTRKPKSTWRPAGRPPTPPKPTTNKRTRNVPSFVPLKSTVLSTSPTHIPVCNITRATIASSVTANQFCIQDFQSWYSS
jgi:hypothetical protein